MKDMGEYNHPELGRGGGDQCKQLCKRVNLERIARHWVHNRKTHAK